MTGSHDKSMTILQAMGWYAEPIAHGASRGFYRLKDTDGRPVPTARPGKSPAEIWAGAPNIYETRYISIAWAALNWAAGDEVMAPAIQIFWECEDLWTLPLPKAQQTWLDKIYRTLADWKEYYA